MFTNKKEVIQSRLKSDGPQLEETVSYLYEEGLYWMEDKYVFSYNNNGKIAEIEQYYQDFPSMVLDNKQSITYNNSDLASIINYNPQYDTNSDGEPSDENDFFPDGISKLTYDNNGFLTLYQYISKDYDFDVKEYIYDTATNVFENEYNTNGDVTQITWYISDENKKPYRKETYHYNDNGLFTSMITYEFMSNNWVEKWKSTREYNSDNKLSHTEGFTFQNNEWEDDYTEELTYDKNGNIAAIEMDIIYEGYLQKTEFFYDLDQQSSLSEYDFYLFHEELEIDFVPEYYTDIKNLLLKSDFTEADYGSDQWDPFAVIVFDYQGMDPLNPDENNAQAQTDPTQNPTETNITTDPTNNTIAITDPDDTNNQANGTSSPAINTAEAEIAPAELAQFCDGAIVMSQSDQQANYAIFSATGILAAQGTFSGSLQLTDLTLTPGIYIITIETDSELMTMTIPVD